MIRAVVNEELGTMDDGAGDRLALFRDGSPLDCAREAAAGDAAPGVLLDGIAFEGVAQGSLQIYQSGADAVIQLPGGTGGRVVANTSLAQLDGHLFYA